MFNLKTTRDGRFGISSGERIRTTDLRVMSPTSYLCSTPQRNVYYRGLKRKSQAFGFSGSKTTISNRSTGQVRLRKETTTNVRKYFTAVLANQNQPKALAIAA